LTDHDGVASVYLVFGEFPPDCTGTTATVQKTDGTHVQVVPFTEYGGTGMPPTATVTALIPIPLADGAGDWVVTKVARGTESLTVSVPFHILRGSTASIEQPATVVLPAKTTITGVVRRYTPTGSLAPSAGRFVRIDVAPPPDYGWVPKQVATATTDSTGRYRAMIAISAPVTFLATVDPDTQYGAARTGEVTANVLASLSPLTASSVAYIGRWWRVSGTAFPVRLATILELWTGSQWVSTLSIGRPAADGTFTRWWKPTAAGTYRLRVQFGTDPRIVNTPLFREVTVTVRPRPTTITGTADPTVATIIRTGTKMSTYGHLSVMYTTGRTGPFAGQQVVVQIRPRCNTDAGYSTVATATTTSTGYYYANWNVIQDVDVRVAFLSPYQSIASSYRWLRVVDVA
ncbi:MAG TPA: hypothetical protein VGJ44_25760, partial [Kribbellaceae bacterium]